VSYLREALRFANRRRGACGCASASVGAIEAVYRLPGGVRRTDGKPP
jgi:hypothetical protein